MGIDRFTQGSVWWRNRLLLSGFVASFFALPQVGRSEDQSAIDMRWIFPSGEQIAVTSSPAREGGRRRFSGRFFKLAEDLPAVWRTATEGPKTGQSAVFNGTYDPGDNSVKYERRLFPTAVPRCDLKEFVAKEEGIVAEDGRSIILTSSCATASFDQSCNAYCAEHRSTPREVLLLPVDQKKRSSPQAEGNGGSSGPTATETVGFIHQKIRESSATIRFKENGASMKVFNPFFKFEPKESLIRCGYFFEWEKPQSAYRRCPSNLEKGNLNRSVQTSALAKTTIDNEGNVFKVTINCAPGDKCISSYSVRSIFETDRRCEHYETSRHGVHSSNRAESKTCFVLDSGPAADRVRKALDHLIELGGGGAGKEQLF